MESIRVIKRIEGYDQQLRLTSYPSMKRIQRSKYTGYQLLLHSFFTLSNIASLYQIVKLLLMQGSTSDWYSILYLTAVSPPSIQSAAKLSLPHDATKNVGIKLFWQLLCDVQKHTEKHYSEVMLPYFYDILPIGSHHINWYAEYI